MSSYDAFGTPNHGNPLDSNEGYGVGTGAATQSSPSSVTQTVTVSVRKKFSKLKTLVLKLKPNNRRPDLSSLDSEQLDSFVDEMIDDLRETLTKHINDLRERIKSARPNSSDPNYTIKMKLYQELLTNMVPIIQKLQNLTGQILNELHGLINKLWNDICQNNGSEVDQLLNEHAYRTETLIYQSFLEPLSVLEVTLKQIQ